MRNRSTLVGLAALPLVAAQGEFDFGSLLAWVLIGAIIGALARLVVPGPSPLGILGTILVGIVGALVGGWLAAMLDASTFVTWIVAVLVAAALVWLLTRFSASRTRS